MKNSSYHSPVLFAECMDYLVWNPKGEYADCTLGGGGHSEGILEHLAPEGHLHSFDRDLEAIAFASARLERFGSQVTFHPVAFGRLGAEVRPNSLSGVLYDLGISSHQVDDDARGFTFQGSHPIDLRMDSREGVSAQEWLRNTSVEDMTCAFKENSDLDRAYKLSIKIKDAIRNLNSPVLPSHIRTCVERTFPDKMRDANGILARVFQAIRMEVNGELNEIRESMRSAVDSLVKGGRLVVISYHSVEDRCVKTTAAEFEMACLCPPKSPVCVCGGNHQKLKKVNRKPILPSEEEIAKNPRARSAKLRVYERV
ncbi:MAG: 16S rRNA (cytosine(1402)-N(4))-methyltransferase RsmH [Fibrobacteraceae bacterium]